MFEQLSEEFRVQLKDMIKKVCAEMLIKVQSNPDYDVTLASDEWDGFEQLVRTMLLIEAVDACGFIYFGGRDQQ